MTHPRSLRRWLPALVAALALLVAACGDDSDGDTSSDVTDAPTVTDALVTDDPPTTDPAATDDDDAVVEDPPADDETADAAAPVAVDLGEFFIDMPATFTAGTLTFDASNSGEFPHALAVARGTSYEELPLLDNGAVDTDALGADFLGTTDNFETGQGGSLTVDLEAGDYVFFCPVAFGPNSHAGNGQVLSVSVG